MPGLTLLLAAGLAMQARAEALVARLGDAHFVVRERATSQLRQLDLAAVPALRKAAKDPDPEVRRRCCLLMDSIGAGRASKDSPPVRGLTRIRIMDIRPFVTPPVPVEIQ